MIKWWINLYKPEKTLHLGVPGLFGGHRPYSASSILLVFREIVAWRGPGTSPISVLGQLCSRQVSRAQWSLTLPKSGMKWWFIKAKTLLVYDILISETWQNKHKAKCFQARHGSNENHRICSILDLFYPCHPCPITEIPSDTYGSPTASRLVPFPGFR